MTWHAACESLGATFDKELDAFKFRFDRFILFASKICSGMTDTGVREEVSAAWDR
jgi:hypothetical protein